MRYQVSGGIVSLEWDASIIRSSVDPERPEPTMKNGAVVANSLARRPPSVTVLVKFTPRRCGYPAATAREAQTPCQDPRRVHSTETCLKPTLTARLRRYTLANCVKGITKLAASARFPSAPNGRNATKKLLLDQLRDSRVRSPKNLGAVSVWVL